MSYRQIFHLKVVKVNQSSESTLKLSVVWDTNFSPFIICKIEFGSKAKKHTPVATSQEYFPSFSERHRRWLEGFSWLWNVSSLVKTILKKKKSRCFTLGNWWPTFVLSAYSSRFHCSVLSCFSPVFVMKTIEH